MAKAWGQLFDALQAKVLSLGVCPKILNAANNPWDAKYCGKPIAMGTRFCEKHRYGV